MPRYIDADKLICSLDGSECLDTERDYEEIERRIEECETADVQEVIYCKNCKNYLKFENGDVVCEEFGGYIKDNDFCSRGERKGGKD